MSDWKKSLPMWMTYTRIALAPTLFLILCENLPNRFLIGMGLFVVAGLTDWLDGYWARVYNCESNLGKFMDPIADKVLMLAALLCLQELGSIEAIMVFMILIRDLMIGGLRSVAATNNIIIAAKPTGKLKTALQMGAVPAIFWARHSGQIFFETIGYWVLWGTVALSLLSAVEYLSCYIRERPIKS